MKIMHDDKKIRGIIAAVDDLETEKATLSDVETLLASGDVEDIKADSIIENMTGYSAATYSYDDDNMEITPAYVGIVKNGNKLTITYCGNIKLVGATTTYNPLLAVFTIPASIGAKIFPARMTGYSTYVDVKQQDLFTSPSAAATTKNIAMRKASDTSLEVSMFGAGGLSVNQDYFFRYEITFLLSESLATA